MASVVRERVGREEIDEVYDIFRVPSTIEIFFRCCLFGSVRCNWLSPLDRAQIM